MMALAAKFESREVMPVRTIAELHQIPMPFLLQILLTLKTARLVESTRGVAGGYRLAKSPDSISLSDILAAVEGPPVSPETDPERSPTARALAEIWNHLNQLQSDYLSTTTLADLLDRARGEADKMYYI